MPRYAIDGPEGPYHWDDWSKDCYAGDEFDEREPEDDDLDDDYEEFDDDEDFEEEDDENDE